MLVFITLTAYSRFVVLTVRIFIFEKMILYCIFSEGVYFLFLGNRKKSLQLQIRQHNSVIFTMNVVCWCGLQEE